MSARRVRPCDDRANPRGAADHVMVQNVEIVATVARALLQSHRKDDPLAVASETDLELLADRHRGDDRHHVGDTTDGLSIHGQQNIPLFDAIISSRRAGNDGLDQNARPSLELLARSDLI